MINRMKVVVFCIIEIFLIGINISCTPKEGDGIINIRLDKNNTYIIISNKQSPDFILGKYPHFPGLDESSPDRSKNFIKYANGNALILMPDISNGVKTAWNDYTGLFDILFVNVSKKDITNIISDDGRNLRSYFAHDKGYIVQVEEKVCVFYVINDNGVVITKKKYPFTVFPDVIAVEESNTQYIVHHSSIDGEEKIQIDKDKL